MVKKIVNHVQEAQRVPGRINPRRNTSSHMVMKMTKIKDKEKLLKATRGKRQATYKSADFSTGTVQTRREWHDILQVMAAKTTLPCKTLIQV